MVKFSSIIRIILYFNIIISLHCNHKNQTGPKEEFTLPNWTKMFSICLLFLTSLSVIQLIKKKKRLNNSQITDKNKENTLSQANPPKRGAPKKMDPLAFEKYRMHKGGFSFKLDPNYDANSNCKVTFPIAGEEKDCFFIENLFTKKECEDLIEIANKEGFMEVEEFDDDIRNNCRRRTFDKNMSEIIFNRLKDFMPEKTKIIDGLHWELSHFMDFWRYLRYKHGQQFKTHYDGSKKFANEENNIFEMTIFTLNVYLNEGFTAGGTRFYMNCKESAKCYDDEEAGPVTHTINSKQGGALVFNHCNKGYLHDGEPLDVSTSIAKEKYLLRADLIYRLRESDIPLMKKKLEENSCRWYSLQLAKDGLVEDYIGNTWKCACVSKHFY